METVDVSFSQVSKLICCCVYVILCNDNNIRIITKMERCYTVISKRNEKIQYDSKKGRYLYSFIICDRLYEVHLAQTVDNTNF